MNELRKLQLVQLELLRKIDHICRTHGIQYYLTEGTLLGAVRHKGFIPWDDDIDIEMPLEDYKKFCKICELELDKSKYFLQNMENDPNHRYIFAKFRRQGTLCVRKGQEHMSFHQGIYIDIFPLYPVPTTKTAYKIFSFIIARCKTVLWSPIGAVSEKQPFMRLIYKILSKAPKKVPEKIIFCLISKCSGELVHYIGVPAFGNNKILSKRLKFVKEHNLMKALKKWEPSGSIELEFEGYKFFVPQNYDYRLTFTYGDYMELPPVSERIGHHQAAIIDFGDALLEIEGN